MQENRADMLRPGGRIDSTSAPGFDSQIKEYLDRNPSDTLTIDLDRLTYISSAGLRVLLSASKRLSGGLTVTNVSPEIYEILDMTGFTSILNVERRLRTIDVGNCEVIGRGAVGTVYRIDPDTIVKVYESPDALEMIKNEQLRAKQAFIKGIPTAISYDAVRVGDYYGSVFELLDARTFSSVLSSDPGRFEELVRKHVEVMKAIHGTEAEPGELPDSRDVYLKYLDDMGTDMPGDLRARLEDRFRAMPEDLHLIHGDIHMKNVMLCGDEPVLIDMETLCTGNPVFDLADLFVAYKAFNEDEAGNSEAVIGFSDEMCDRVYDRTIELYLEPYAGEDRDLILKKIMTVGYVRFLYLISMFHYGGEDLAEKRIRHSVEHLRQLMDMLPDIPGGFAI